MFVGWIHTKIKVHKSGRELILKQSCVNIGIPVVPSTQKTLERRKMLELYFAFLMWGKGSANTLLNSIFSYWT
ncbi:hypothetical protein SLEP1_g14817 [Rubroshorea leprosula]|uniref:Uncharacterized protein n=1 Tax=Rubroshorea leprosula TaxID=152421 RepID=A0AAV5IT82_9ROSI|nr:hypothetical protein SLEP1_g14817 [Rubroshorea leprosula]